MAKTAKLARVQPTSFVITLVDPAEAISPPGDLPIHPLPERQTAGNVKYWSQPPKAAESSGQISNRGCSGVTIPLAIDDVHLLHQHIVRQVGIPPCCLRIVQREIRQLPSAVPPSQLVDLSGTHAAVAVVDDDVRARPLLGSWQMGCRFGLQGRRHICRPKAHRKPCSQSDYTPSSAADRTAERGPSSQVKTQLM